MNARRESARHLWKSIALSQAEQRDETWSLRERARVLDSPDARAKLEDFLALKGTYFINGLASCQVGDGFVHPFETHGYAKSLTFHGDGLATYRARITDTPCSSVERSVGKVVHRGVMSKGPPWPLNLLLPSDRDTANIALRAWPAPGAPHSRGGSSERLARVLLAGGDNGTPYALDPLTLETLGPVASVLPGLRELQGKRLLAHTRYDASRGLLIFASSDIDVSPVSGGARSVLEFLEVDASGSVVGHSRQETDFVVMHDFQITDSYYVVAKNPALLKWGGLAKFLIGLGSGLKVFDMAREQPASIMLIPRPHTQKQEQQEQPQPPHQQPPHQPQPPSAPVRLVEAKARAFFNIFHFGPCHELPAADGKPAQVVISALVFDSYRFGAEMGYSAETSDFDPIKWSAGGDAPSPRLDHFVIDVAAAKFSSRERLSVLCTLAAGEPPVDVPIDMPTMHPLSDGREGVRFFYAAGAIRPEGWFPFNALVKADVGTRPVGAHAWLAPENSMVSEPLLLPRGRGGSEWLGAEAEDDGFVVSIVHDVTAAKCELYVFDARRFHEGPFAAIDLGALAPWNVHANWAPAEDPQ